MTSSCRPGQDQQFVGRVQLDKDVLRDGRLRLHVSRLRTEDSGWYLCDVKTNYGVDFGECRLNVSGKLVENFINRFNSAAFLDQQEPKEMDMDYPLL